MYINKKKGVLDEKEAFVFIKENMLEFKRGFEYSREGWEYELENCKIFIENIKKYQPSIEIEADDQTKLQTLCKKIGITKLVTDSIPQIMSKILSKNKNSSS
ncbi:MAG: hypothetical protein Q8R37_06100 [Nanoarchaeota archaeon]|nr:hypothetical protein [Nanoarchaeota archaeon]